MTKNSRFQSPNFAFLAQHDSLPVEPSEVVLGRGPIHEAFADVIALSPSPGIIAPRKAADPIEELPPEAKPAGSRVQWIPGYWAWDEERNDFIWISGGWRDAPPNRRWIPGYWAQVTEGYEWISGYWVVVSAADVYTQSGYSYRLIAGLIHCSPITCGSIANATTITGKRASNESTNSAAITPICDRRMWLKKETAYVTRLASRLCDHSTKPHVTMRVVSHNAISVVRRLSRSGNYIKIAVNSSNKLGLNVARRQPMYGKTRLTRQTVYNNQPHGAIRLLGPNYNVGVLPNMGRLLIESQVSASVFKCHPDRSHRSTFRCDHQTLGQRHGGEATSSNHTGSVCRHSVLQELTT